VAGRRSRTVFALSFPNTVRNGCLLEVRPGPRRIGRTVRAREVAPEGPVPLLARERLTGESHLLRSARTPLGPCRPVGPALGHPSRGAGRSSDARCVGDGPGWLMQRWAGKRQQGGCCSAHRSGTGDRAARVLPRGVREARGPERVAGSAPRSRPPLRSARRAARSRARPWVLVPASIRPSGTTRGVRRTGWKTRRRRLAVGRPSAVAGVACRCRLFPLPWTRQDVRAAEGALMRCTARRLSVRRRNGDPSNPVGLMGHPASSRSLR
jgi:hypothetical protein